jgi:ATP-binding cassette subfamily C protein
MPLKTSGILETGRRLLTLVDRKTQRRSLFILCLLILSAGLEALGVGLIFPLVTMIINNGGLPPSLEFLSEFITDISEDDLILYGAVSVFSVFLIKNLLLLGILFIQSKYVMSNLRFAAHQLHERYLHAPYAFFLKRHSSDLVQNVAQGANSAFVGSFMGFITLITELLVAIAIAAALFLIDPIVTSVTIVFMVGGSSLFYLLFHRHYAYWGQRTLECSKAMLKSLQEGYGSIKEIKVLGREVFLTQLFNQPLNEFTITLRNKLVMLQAPRLWLETVLLFGVAVIILLLLKLDGSAERLMATVSVFAAAGFRILPSFNRLMMGLNRIKDTQHAVNVIYEDTMLLKTDEVETPHVGEPDLSAWQRLTLEHVSFQYDNTKVKIIYDLHLTIERGEVIGLVGRSGAGKTTLADLILGLHVPTEGQISVDKSNIQDVRRAWQDQLGYVAQDVSLIDDELRLNIAFGQIADEIDNRRLNDAVKLAQLTDVVKQMPDGVYTKVGERGDRVSGGQKQRIGIARALYHNPSLIVFDEATSALDQETEHAIRKTIDSLRGKRTLIIIAHRLNTVRSCDRIVFMENGAIAAIGDFDTLVEQNKSFKHLVTLNNPEYIDNA